MKDEKKKKKKSENDQEDVNFFFFFFAYVRKEVEMTYFAWGIRHSSNDSSRG